MSDPENDDVYTWEVIVPEGDWEYKVILNQNWDQDTHGGAGNFSVSSDGEAITIFTYDFRQNGTYHIIDDDITEFPGDANLDNDVNILDVVTVVGYILGQSLLDGQAYNNADINSDNDINILDIVLIVDIILSN